MNWDGLGAYGTIPFCPLRLFAGDVLVRSFHVYKYLYIQIFP